MTNIRLLLVDDQDTIRRGLAMCLTLESDIEIIGEAGDGTEAIRLARELHPDVILMDVEMRGLDGIAATAAIGRLPRPSVVVALSIHDDCATRARARAAGATAFVGKHDGCEAVLAAIRGAASQPRPLPNPTPVSNCTVARA